MEVIDSFIVPLLHEALATKKARGQGDIPKDMGDEDETLLSHLVNIIDGMLPSLCLNVRYFQSKALA